MAVIRNKPKAKLISKRLYWKELGDNGTIKEPLTIGSFYNQVEVNIEGGFYHEADAVDRLNRLVEKYELSPNNLILITKYEVEG